MPRKPRLPASITTPLFSAAQIAAIIAKAYPYDGSCDDEEAARDRWDAFIGWFYDELPGIDREVFAKLCRDVPVDPFDLENYPAELAMWEADKTGYPKPRKPRKPRISNSY